MVSSNIFYSCTLTMTNETPNGGNHFFLLFQMYRAYFNNKLIELIMTNFFPFLANWCHILRSFCESLCIYFFFTNSFQLLLFHHIWWCLAPGGTLLLYMVTKRITLLCTSTTKTWFISSALVRWNREWTYSRKKKRKMTRNVIGASSQRTSSLLKQKR